MIAAVLGACESDAAAPRDCPGALARVTAAMPDLAPAARCALLRVVLDSLASPRAAALGYAPGDTARVVGVGLYKLVEEELDVAGGVRRRRPYWDAEADVPGRARLFRIMVDSATGRIEVGAVHR